MYAVRSSVAFVELLGALANLPLQVLVHVLELEVLLARDLVEALDLALEVVVVEGLAKRGLELVVVPRLGDQAVDLALVDRLDCDRHLGVAGEHHAHHVRVPVANVREQIDAAHLGHALIGDDDLGLDPVEQFEGFLGPGGCEHLHVLVAQEPLQCFEDVHLVVDEDNCVFVHCPSPWRRNAIEAQCVAAGPGLLRPAMKTSIGR